MKKIYHALAALVILISACKKETSVQQEKSQNTRGKVITYHLKNGGQVTVQINSRGEYVVGGDVILSKDQIAYLEFNKVGNNKVATTESTFTADFQKLWPGGIVYYVINDATHSSDILNAMSDWEASTPIHFVQRTNQANYVNFQGAPSNGGGDSQLGMVGGQQLIRLSTGADKSTVIHEIGHAVGLMHEQTRTDRDQYINIDFNNINNDWIDQYKTYDVLGKSGSQIGTFDYNSVMLYPSSVSEARVGSNTAPQMTRKDGSTWGYNSFLSQGDIEGVNALYKLIYCKVSTSRGEIYQMDDWNESYDDNVNIEFFSDPSLSTPLPLPRNVIIRVSYVKVSYPISEQAVTNYMYYDVEIPQGYNSYSAGMENRIHYNGNMGIQAGSYTMGLTSIGIMNAFSSVSYH
ncbi:Astacin (Peptidase family M12A) [Pedobacter suwonensis]|uniref:Astacin (Peptidase family M12A) n=1 Tax=Pedobacter suwonensis TaxID=332999 RepID=A0A1I0TQN8_9SPHI|nr:M12 family metallopeptidase [Pedobacter suwonensis]SFA54074.1 Astacin (Peptidase family M12A) [Pedobacter suwonensis]